MDRPSYIKPKEQTEQELTATSNEATLGTELIALKETKEEIEARLKEVNADIERVEAQLVELMEARGLDLFRAGGVTFFTSQANYPSVTDKDAFVAWLDEHGMGAIAKRTVHPSTLKSWVKEMLEGGQGLPAMVNNFVKTRINTRRTGK